jgi:hypothetical protein
MIRRSPEASWLFLLFSDRNFVTPIIESRCAPLQESDRTLRDGSFGLAMSQALRARLRSHRPSGTKSFAHRGPRIKLALMGLQPWDHQKKRFTL